VLDPSRRVAEVHRPGRVYAHGAPGVVTLDDVLPGWQLDLGEVFQ
jgi:hypothetical protein